MHTMFPTPTRLQRAILYLAATRPGSWFLSRILARFDRAWLRLTGGRRTLTTAMTGLPVVQLTTRGVKSGRPRVCPLIMLPDGNRLIVFASNFGSQRHPAWYLNLRANPNVNVEHNGASAPYRARPAGEAERARYWRQAVAMYPGYRVYERRAGGRRIPIIVLEPLREHSGMVLR
ncbi:MAG TPA: nitroreductase/quinone reductase family protein [Anaerolineales bacterium]|nr:nitroreductase/quinone reductase family protein [Anaerolineales bacterium]